ncbi:MAG: hypothetical protein ACLTDF_03470 [Coprococcus sp.]
MRAQTTASGASNAYAGSQALAKGATELNRVNIDAMLTECHHRS